MTITTLPVGNTREPSTILDIRTPEQRDAIRAIAGRDDFAFACHNPCDELTRQVRPDYVGPFWFQWFDTGDVLHVARIGKGGKVLRELTGDAARTVRG